MTIDCARCGQPTPIAGILCVNCGEGSEIADAARRANDSYYRGTSRAVEGDYPWRWVPMTTMLDIGPDQPRGPSPEGALRKLDRFAGLEYEPKPEISAAERAMLRTFAAKRLTELLGFAVQLDCALILGGVSNPPAVQENARLRRFIQIFYQVHGADRIFAKLAPDERGRLSASLTKHIPIPTENDLHAAIEIAILRQAARNAQRAAEIAGFRYSDPAQAFFATSTGELPTIFGQACDHLAAPGEAMKALGLGKRRRFG